jgi:uroporphyrinogen decarboxylase
MPMEKISHMERIQAVLAGQQPDRIPVALWRHFPVDDQDPLVLAESAVHFQQEYDLDLIKVTPASSFCLRDWGVQDVWEGNTEGTRRYTRVIVKKPGDWEQLKVLDPKKGALADQLVCLQEVVRRAGGKVPVIQTIFNPLAQAKHICGTYLLKDHMARYPDALRAGLEIITKSTVSFVEACMEKGADGIFLAVQHANPEFAGEEAYRQWAERDDKAILNAAKGSWLNLLHLHGANIHFPLAADYPVQVVNWHDREAKPSLEEGCRLSGKTVCGGWRQWDTMALGDAKKVEAEARDAIRRMQGKNLLLGTGCVTPIIAPRTCLKAAAQRWGVEQENTI